MSLRLGALTYDCADAHALARFYAGVLETEVDPDASEFFASIGTSGGAPVTMLFLQTPERASSTGPATAKNPVHLDLLDTAWPAGRDRVAALGAELVGDFAEHGLTWTTFRDPEGYLFDIASTEGH